MPFDTAALEAALRTRCVGRRLLFAETMASTNQTLLEAAKAGRAVCGMVALCERQTAGRGRQRRLWHSPAGLNLYFSVLWESRQPPERMPQLAMVAALALREALETGISYAAARQRALEALGAEAAALDGPNDLLGIEYLNAIRDLKADFTPMAIPRAGAGHDQVGEGAYRSAS